MAANVVENDENVADYGENKAETLRAELEKGWALGIAEDWAEVPLK